VVLISFSILSSKISEYINFLVSLHTQTEPRKGSDLVTKQAGFSLHAGIACKSITETICGTCGVRIEFDFPSYWWSSSRGKVTTIGFARCFPLSF